MTTSAGAPVADTTARYLSFGEWRTEPTAELTDRSYTSHKHNNMGSDGIGIIYMNARYYVLGIARFASADTIVPNPSNPQSYNRYSYVRNNPLNFTDPTGHIECGALPSEDAQGCDDSSLWDALTSFFEERQWRTSIFGINNLISRYIVVDGYGWVDPAHMAFSYRITEEIYAGIEAVLSGAQSEFTVRVKDGKYTRTLYH